MGDFADHVTTVFTDVRLKRFLEMRGADAGGVPMLMAKPAFWTGLLYDAAAQKAAATLVRGWSVQELRALRMEVPKLALHASIGGRALRDIAREAVAISRDGLKARGLGEEVFLSPLEEIAASGVTQAERWLQRYDRAWAGDVSRIFSEAEV
jgi:glutamate--cysteine ligase